MECKRVQELRPSCSTSGGQSLGGACCCALREDLVCWAQAAKEVQVRQLGIGLNVCLEQRVCR